MLVPLHTLVVLPLSFHYSPMNALILLIGIPVVAGIVIAVVVGATTRSHHGAHASYTDPTWIGSTAKHDDVLGNDNAAGQAALQGGPTGGAAGADDKGGASARW